MPSIGSVHIRKRVTKSGPRYVVRYRLGGRAFPLVHAGSFATHKEAKARRDFIAGEIAAARDPATSLLAVQAKQREHHTLGEWAALYEASRVDYADETRRNLPRVLKRITDALGSRDPLRSKRTNRACLGSCERSGWVERDSRGAARKPPTR